MSNSKLQIFKVEDPYNNGTRRATAHYGPDDYADESQLEASVLFAPVKVRSKAEHIADQTRFSLLLKASK